jgi:hypothetical protein
MASIASELSDILTSTITRNEDPDIIIKEMEEGVAAENYKKYAITDRKQAIKTACQCSYYFDCRKGMKPIKKLMECVKILMT